MLITSSSHQRRVLIISTTFFPDPTVSAIRMTQWCRHLAQNGWKPYVLCRYYGHECSPEEFAAKVHPDVTVEYLDKPAPGASEHSAGRWRERMRWGARRFFSRLSIARLVVPDVSILFWRRNRERILAYVQEIKPDLIITTSPPHSNHDIGLWLAAQTGIPWVADFRDSYLLDVRYKPVGVGKLRIRAHQRYERAIYRRAWLTTHAIPIQARWVRRYYPFARERVQTLTNGFPLELLDELATEAPIGHRKTVLVAGTITEPEALRLADAVSRLAREGHEVELKLAGKKPKCEANLRDMLGDRLRLTDSLSHTEAVCEIARADVLVNFLDKFRSESLLLSTKLFEYLATGTPVICINPSRSDRHLLRGMTGVDVMYQPDVNDLASAVRRCLLESSRRDPEEVACYRASSSWARNLEQLDNWLHQLINFPPTQVVEQSRRPIASVVIPSRNRKEILHQTIRSALAQTVPVEVIIMDDGSTDGSVEMVRDEFPFVRLYQLGQKKGPAFQRNRGIELASSSFVFPIDDDSVFSSSRVVEQTLAEFSHPRVAAVGIPFLNPRLDWQRKQFQPQGVSGIAAIHAFVGASHAVRKEAFLEVGGYREHFFYMGEEGDLGIRLIKHGYIVRLGKADPVYHLESPRRDHALADFCGRRNDVLFAWHNVPTPFLLLHLTMTTINGLRCSFTSAHPMPMLRGILSGYASCWKHRRERTPVSAQIYWLHRRLKKRRATKLEEFEHILPRLPNA